MHRFNTATLDIRNLDMGVALAALTTALQPKSILYSLGKKLPANIGELMARAQKYINLEEMMDTRGNHIKLKRKGNNRETREPSRPTKRQDTSTLHTNSKTRGDSSKFSTYTPLNALQSDVLMHIRKKDYVSWPESMQTPSYKRNMSKFFQFHRDHRHDTKECIQLKNEIEALIKRGYLSRFINNGDRQGKPHEQKRPNEDEKEEHIIGEIAVIFGGSASGGDSRGARKRYAKQILSTKRGEPSGKRNKQDDVIIFDNGDEEGVQQPHDNALVVSLLVANYKLGQYQQRQLPQQQEPPPFGSFQSLPKGLVRGARPHGAHYGQQRTFPEHPKSVNTSQQPFLPMLGPWSPVENKQREEQIKNTKEKKEKTDKHSQKA
ncbi:uncharacterized protein LOC131158686 [Malania oleifera]|uniref:uncharacterized protein LOC131158686 n=1 Tax=Malania oleifera TaxID=397392 RepID=UPI0025AE5459|nr:uncharacterized protein LOC131158686 [Malania oleifera]